MSVEDTTKHDDHSEDTYRLSAKELAIISLVSEGLTNTKIAEEINRQPLTVKAHLARISSRLGVKGRERMVKIAVEQGWVEPAQNERFSKLSPREIQVAELIGEGFTNQQIADLLFISVDTVSVHIARIFFKLKINKRVLIVPLLISPRSS